MTLIAPTKPLGQGFQSNEMTPHIKARKCRAIRVAGLRLFLATAIALGGVVATNVAKAAGSSRSAIQAKIRYCEDCHGASAQGYRGYYPIPRLAGQQPQYLKNQLLAFINGSRPNPIMSNVAHVLRPDLIDAIAVYFYRLHSAPIGGEPRNLVSTGRDIFENGVPEDNVAACAACHGPAATGTGEIPRLAGQLYPYVVKALVNWPKERGQNPKIRGASFVMLPVAHSLSRNQIKAVAAFVSSLR